ncbi:MAG: TPM domain-containing protein, partial [gamma proteobacterium symbiont of Bathyaustriella thionipta]|nr:TPM domain-containing protein [gamma proteobacterium symbiont of Bathyaustriella thionipta]
MSTYAKWLWPLVLLSMGLAYFLYSGRSVESQRLQDEAGLFTSQQADRLRRFHDFLLQDHDIDYFVLTRKGLADIDRAALDNFTALQVGRHSHSGRGLLLLIDPQRNQLRLEVSRALEAVYPDAFVAYIEQRQMLPFFASGRVSDGILASTEMIITRAQNADDQQAWDDESRAAAQSQGGGASTAAKIGKGKAAKSTAGLDIVRDADPESVLNAYIRAMQARNNNPDLAIYSTATRKMFAEWVVTPAQMDNAVKSFRHCSQYNSRRFVQSQRAVIRYPAKARACNPWFFVRENGRWRLDFSMMKNHIRFGRSNAWHFVESERRKHPYPFAFQDWRFDK